jgi:hypothetical protein
MIFKVVLNNDKRRIEFGKPSVNAIHLVDSPSAPQHTLRCGGLFRKPASWHCDGGSNIDNNRSNGPDGQPSSNTSSASQILGWLGSIGYA